MQEATLNAVADGVANLHEHIEAQRIRIDGELHAANFALPKGGISSPNPSIVLRVYWIPRQDTRSERSLDTRAT